MKLKPTNNVRYVKQTYRDIGPLKAEPIYFKFIGDRFARWNGQEWYTTDNDFSSLDRFSWRNITDDDYWYNEFVDEKEVFIACL